MKANYKPPTRSTFLAPFILLLMALLALSVKFDTSNWAAKDLGGGAIQSDYFERRH